MHCTLPTKEYKQLAARVDDVLALQAAITSFQVDNNTDVLPDQAYVANFIDNLPPTYNTNDITIQQNIKSLHNTLVSDVNNLSIGNLYKKYKPVLAKFNLNTDEAQTIMELSGMSNDERVALINNLIVC
jgi:hypothetical protein